MKTLPAEIRMLANIAHITTLESLQLIVHKVDDCVEPKLFKAEDKKLLILWLCFTI